MEKILSLTKLSYGKKPNLDTLKKFNTYFAILFLGIVLGVLFSNLFQNYYYAAWESWHGQFKTGLSSVPINGGELFVYIIIGKIESYILLWALAMTIFGTPYIYAYCVYKGFTMGFLFCLIMQTHGLRAFLVFGAYYFPQCLLYIPAFLMTFAGCREMNRRWGKDGQASMAGKVQSLRHYLMNFFLLLLLLILGCLLEAYVNPGILKNVL